MKMLSEKASSLVDKEQVTLSPAVWGRSIILAVPSSALSTLFYENYHPCNEELAAYFTRTHTHTPTHEMG